MQKLLQLLVFYLTYAYYFCLLKTIRFVHVGRDDYEASFKRGENPVFATPHFSLIPVVLAYDKSPTILLASQSRDGALIANILKKRGFEVIRGSSNRRSAVALKELLAKAKHNKAIGVAFDGPKGPPLIPKPGIAYCASHASGPFFLLYAKPMQSRMGRLFFKLKTWDKMLLPLPFCKIKVVCKKLPIKMPLEKDKTVSALKTLEEFAKLEVGEWYN